MRLVQVAVLTALLSIAACAGRSTSGAVPARLATRPDVSGQYVLEVHRPLETRSEIVPASLGGSRVNSGRGTLALQIDRGPTAGSYIASMSDSAHYQSSVWRGKDLVFTGTDNVGNTEQLKLRFKGSEVRGIRTHQSPGGPFVTKLKGRKS